MRKFLELIRFSHTLFAMPFALLSAAMAWRGGAGSDSPVVFRWPCAAGIVLAMVFARSAAMAFNRLADRRLDALNPRTRTRHLPTGALGVRGVALFTLLCSLGFVGSTLLFLPANPLPLIASVPVLLFLFAYSYTKRFTVLAHVWLGAALGLAPLAAWVALRGEVAAAPAMLGAAVVLWVAGFDMIYACLDFDFDVKMGLYSAPARFGVAAALRLAAACHFGMIVLLAALPLVYGGFGRIYLMGVGMIAALLVYEHILVRPDDLRRVNRAFFGVNAVVGPGLLAAGVIDLWMK
jgi:4-hydroxybenzoate polyprenyltransferase